MFDPINLDGLSSDMNDVREAGKVFKIYTKYCALQADAWELRTHGKIGAAMRTEKKMETLYQSLPNWAKW